METKFTKGEWKIGISKNENEPDYLAIFPNSTKEGERSKIICLISQADKITEHDESNAKLIAAAPELLEATELAKVFIDYVKKRKAESLE